MWVLETLEDWTPVLTEVDDERPLSAPACGRLFQTKEAALLSHLRCIRKHCAAIERALPMTLELLDRPMSDHHRTTPGVWTLNVADGWLPNSNLLEGASPEVADGVWLFATRNAALRRHQANLMNERLAIWSAINSTVTQLQALLDYDGTSPRGRGSRYQIMIDTEPGRDD